MSAENSTILIVDDDHLILVDDDHLILDFLEDVLQESYTVIRADNGRSAADVFRAHEHIDLILLDLGMPEMSGHEALAEFQIVEPDAKIVVVTGMSPEHDELPGILSSSDQTFPGPADHHRC